MCGPDAPPLLFVGIDIAYQTAAVAWLRPGQAPRAAVSLPQTPEGCALLRTRLAATGVPPAHTLVVLEATGTYWCRLALDLHLAGYSVAVINPAGAHYSAKAHLRRAKTDALDAQLLAQFAAQMHPAPLDPAARRLSRVGTTLAVAGATAPRPAGGPQPTPRAAREGGRAQRRGPAPGGVVRFYDEQLAQLEAEIQRHLPADESWARNLALLLTTMGVGVWTALWILVATVNFTSCQRVEEAVSYAGLGAAKRDSGTSVRGRAALPRGGTRRCGRRCI